MRIVVNSDVCKKYKSTGSVCISHVIIIFHTIFSLETVPILDKYGLTLLNEFFTNQDISLNVKITFSKLKLILKGEFNARGGIISSAKHEVQSELSWSLTVQRLYVRHRRLYVRLLTISYKWLILLNQRTDFKITSQKRFLGGLLFKIFK